MFRLICIISLSCAIALPIAAIDFYQVSLELPVTKADKKAKRFFNRAFLNMMVRLSGIRNTIFLPTVEAESKRAGSYVVEYGFTPNEQNPKTTYLNVSFSKSQLIQFLLDNDIPSVPTYYRRVGVSLLLETNDKGYIYLNQQTYPDLETKVKNILSNRGFELAASKNIFSVEDANKMANLDVVELEQLCRQFRFDACIVIMLRPDDVGHLSTSAFFTTPIDSKHLHLYSASVKPDISEIIEIFADEYNFSLLQESDQKRKIVVTIRGVKTQQLYQEILQRLRSIDIVEYAVLNGLTEQAMEVSLLSSSGNLELLLDLLRRAEFFVERCTEDRMELSL